ncbi:hypothetical protein Dtox_0840 [Desulfofarcimen acetoxidans DSM 771]|uniref:Uncharacterized protein n=1 Tax=Desulfofarcimen acetoxidans (strain ATCC 49208 / DSM 771 / KCTC 5769 / VKM B-1644 / 5575) TaxID=485916 RepID=C8W281_DESAS|nr:hypothetical protein [Desulfofarcimen acetoxidans]ACV61745.1 hypothetical protein Dtox_0840 [Desulfofarcimen acetoxidans DSM 771]
MTASPYNRYRMDYRTTEQFARDIKNGSKAERVIINWYIEYYRNKYGENLIVLDNGCVIPVSF